MSNDSMDEESTPSIVQSAVLDTGRLLLDPPGLRAIAAQRPTAAR